MKSFCRAIFTIAATSLIATASPVYAEQPTEPELSANAARVAHEFRHPLLRGDDGRASIDQDLWYVIDDFGDPYGKACRTPQSRVCYSVGENWTHVRRPLGKPVRAAANGEILEFGYSRRSGGKLPDSLGNYILIKHTLPAPGLRIPGIGRVTTVVSLYGYLKDLKGICGNDSRSCKVGQRVRIGGLIGHVGDTGAAKVPSLHFEIRLTDEKCIRGSRPGNISESCFGYARDRYPAQYEGGGGWLDPSCFVEQSRAPRNDSIAKAIAIDVGQTAKGSNRCATKEDGEPNHAGKRIDRHGRNGSGKSVWWKFTAPESVQYTISTVGSEFDTLLGVYTEAGEAGGKLIIVAQNDSEKRNLCSSANYCTSKVSFNAKAGTIYYIAVDGASVEDVSPVSGDIRLTVAEGDTRLFVSPSSTSFDPIYEGEQVGHKEVRYQISASKEDITYWISNLPDWLSPSRTTGRTGGSPRTVTFTVNDSASSLKSGTYTAEVIFGSGGEAPQKRNVTLRVKEVAELVLAPANDIAISGDQGGPFDPVSSSYAISTTAGKATYRISGVPSWLDVAPSSGKATTTAQTITLAPNSSANSLSAGTYNATLTFTNVTNGKGSTSRSVVFTVKGPPKLQVSPATGMVASGMQGGPFSPFSFTYQISATSGTLDYQISGMPNWLSVSSPSGSATTTAKALSFALNSAANSLAAGTYTATVTITNTTNGQGTVTLPVTLTVNPLPIPSLQVSPATPMAVSGLQGGPFNPVSFPYQISATTGTVNFAISGVPSWLTVSSSSGSATTASQTVTFTVNSNANSLSAGSYSATITFNNTTNGVGTTSRAVNLTVTAPPVVSFLTDGNGNVLLDEKGQRLTVM